MPGHTVRFLTVIVVLLAGAGCTHSPRSNTSRTGVEQLLISNAIDQSLDKVSFEPFAGHAVFLEEKYVDAVDKAYLVGSVRHRMLAAGTLLVDKPDDAEIIVELRSGGVGTDTAESFVGIPEITVPGMLTLPEIRVIERTSQSGTAKIGLVAYDAKTRQVLGPGGTSLSLSNDNKWSVGGIGPFREGSIKHEFAAQSRGLRRRARIGCPRTSSSRAPRGGGWTARMCSSPPVNAPRVRSAIFGRNPNRSIWKPIDSRVSASLRKPLAD
jgi:hypothetical protein